MENIGPSNWRRLPRGIVLDSGYEKSFYANECAATRCASPVYSMNLWLVIFEYQLLSWMRQGCILGNHRDSSTPKFDGALSAVMEVCQGRSLNMTPFWEQAKAERDSNQLNA